MEFRILGPLEVVEGDEPIEIPGTKLRALLALLLVNANQVLSTDRLLEGLWGESPPQTAANTLQTHVSHLRKALVRATGAQASEIVVTRSPGYVLSVEPDRIDAWRFERLAQEGREALTRSSPDQALAKLGEALSLWRGPALVDFAFEPFASSEVGRLEELRLAIVADRIEAELALGHHGRLAGELRQLVGEHPLRERLWGQLMLTLYRCGRQAEALRTFSELRNLLGEELGIEPSQELQRLEEAILLQKPDLDWRPPGPSLSEERAAKPPHHNLPVQLTSFVGREKELSQLEDALSEARLVTLVGPGGVGKTRLALAAANRLLGHFRDGVFVVELAPLSDPSLLTQQTLSALGLTEESLPPLDTLVAHLRDGQRLLVLDNCEHLLSACAAFTDALLRRCPQLRILTTSREPLRSPAESTIPVSPLPVPDVQKRQRAEEVTVYDAVQLFLARARAVRPDFEISELNVTGVARLCKRLDGMPLALELAAARIRAMSPDEIAERLDDRFHLLIGTRTGPARHHTLRAAIDWSYDALPQVERTIFNRLSVFAGDFIFEDVEGVCGFSPVVPPDVLDALLALVDKSFVVADGSGTTTRYRMLETLRHYGADKLAETGEQAATGDHLLLWGMSLAEFAETNLDGRDQARWLDILEHEHDNLRAALHWAVSRGEVDTGLRLAAALWRFWEVRGYLTEGRRWLERLLALPGEVSPLLRAKALNSAGVLAQRQSAYHEAQSLYEASLAIRRKLHDQRGTAAALHGIGNLAGLQGEHHRAQALFEESLAIGRTVGEPRIVAASLTNLGWMAHEQGDTHRARELLEESLGLYTELRDGHGAANALHRLGAAAQSEGDWDSARSLYTESLRIQRELGERYGVVWSLAALADVVEAEGDTEGSRRMLEDVLVLAQELGNKYCETITLTRLAEAMWSARELTRTEDLYRRAALVAATLGDSRAMGVCLQGLGRVASARGELPPAARLYGAAHALLRTGKDALDRERADEDGEISAVRQGLGEARFLAEWMAGRAMDPIDAARYPTSGDK